MRLVDCGNRNIKYQKEDRNKRDKFKKILSIEKTNGLTVPEEKSKETLSSNSNDERLSLECGISEKESKFRSVPISICSNSSFYCFRNKQDLNHLASRQKVAATSLEGRPEARFCIPQLAIERE